MRNKMIRTSFLVTPGDLAVFRLKCTDAGLSMANVMRDFIEAVGEEKIIIRRGSLEINQEKPTANP